MNFGITPDQQALVDHVRTLLDDVCPMDYAARCDEQMQPPREAFQALARAGWLGLIAPEEYGGAGGSPTDLALLLEETGNHFEELGLWLFRNFTYGCYAVLKHGTEEQKQRIVPGVVQGELSFAFALTEPDSGSDAAALKTRAVADGDHFVINGRKQFTSGMDIADYVLVALRTSDLGKKQLGISTFLVDTKLPGIEVRKIPTLGQHAIGTTEVTYTDVRVPRSALLGELDKGWAICEDTLRYERLCLSAARIGAARRAFEFALDYAKTRTQFGKPIGSFQVTQHKFADMKVMLDTAQTMVRRYAWLMEHGQAERADTAVIKYYVGESYKTISDVCLQILGGYGYCMEYPMQRFFRDSRLATIGGGTSEIQKNIIAASLGL
ncbi:MULTISPECIES: acyl-CoA dehydrogenase family protein [Ramlibacter]|uniref:Acyl-CoA dehydrogenase n=1 Tax=Ramlibacter pinisoli TaxID=2682844 RepID=A0A6N8IYI7_9BURK|nr:MULTISPECIES: acyl-CoA dehydrogenase family protein [Ramlibacter]MBA2961082.1 acyl-CoA/acyl-ACP dehydrogenase [Ramlibacter sp. CGMCC 1.13660]MVQ31026.1 acyl-CoA dehydrogenase [Ramlibacter pinisoli]